MAKQFMFHRFHVKEKRREVDDSGGVGIAKLDATRSAKWLRHTILLPRRTDFVPFWARGASKPLVGVHASACAAYAR